MYSEEDSKCVRLSGEKGFVFVDELGIMCPDCRISVLHPVDTRVQMLPQVTIPLYEVPAGRGYRALHLQADLSGELRLGGVEESVRQEKLELSFNPFLVCCERSKYTFILIPEFWINVS